MVGKGVVIVIVLLVLVVVGFLVFGGDSDSGVSNVGSGSGSSAGDTLGAVPVGGSVDDTVVEGGSDSGTNTVTISSSGFSPSTLTVDSGDIVTFVNQGTRASWPASAVHPTHRAYPGSDINKCNSAEASSIFDACGGLEEGESYSFTFDEVGTWRYHDHLRSSFTGTIVVR